MLGEALLKGGVKGLFNLGRAGAAKAVKSDIVKHKIKETANHYLDRALDSFTSDLSKRPDPMHSGSDISYSNWYPMEMYTDVTDPTNPLYQRGKGIPIPFPFVDFKKAWNVVTAPGLFKGPSVSSKEGKALVAEYKRQYKAYKDAGGSRSFNSWVKWKGYGSGIDIHKMIGKIPKPKAGWAPGKYKYMGPYNPLENQLEYDKNKGEVTKWHVQPYNKVDEIAAHHDICYDMGKNKGDCDKKMVKSLDEIPYGEMPKWGQTARFLINAKQKLGMGVKKPKNAKSRRVKKTGKNN